jgi:hypothetical protein
LHRHAGYAPWSAVQSIEWGDGGCVVVAIDRLDDLDSALA